MTVPLDENLGFGLYPRVCDKSILCFQVYVLRRLVRGLGSGRQGARQGFALAITALLARVKSVTVAAVLTLLESSLEVSNTMGVRSSTPPLPMLTAISHGQVYKDIRVMIYH